MITLPLTSTKYMVVDVRLPFHSPSSSTDCGLRSTGVECQGGCSRRGPTEVRRFNAMTCFDIDDLSPLSLFPSTIAHPSGKWAAGPRERQKHGQGWAMKHRYLMASKEAQDLIHAAKTVLRGQSGTLREINKPWVGPSAKKVKRIPMARGGGRNRPTRHALSPSGIIPAWTRCLTEAICLFSDRAH